MEPDAAFDEFLEREGIAPEQRASYRRGDEMLRDEAGGGPVYPKHLDLALAGAERRGGTPQQLANLKRIGEVALRFHAMRRASTPPQGPVPEMPGLGAELPVPEARESGASAGGSGLETEAVASSRRPSRAPIVGTVDDRLLARAMAASHAPSAVSCPDCGGGLVVYPGPIKPGQAGAAGGVVGVGLTFLFGAAVVCAVAGFLGAIGTLINLLTTQVRCSRCSRIATGSEVPEDLETELRRARIRGALEVAGLLALSGAGAWVWVTFVLPTIGAPR